MTTWPNAHEALTAAIGHTDADADTATVTEQVSKYLDEHGWQVTEKPPAETIGMVIDPAAAPSGDDTLEPAQALWRGFVEALDVTGIRFATLEFWAAMVAAMEDLYWHVVPAEPGACVYSVGPDEDHVTFPRGHVVIVLNPGFDGTDPELGAILRCVAILQDGPLDLVTRARAARYLADRFDPEGSA